MNKCEFIKKSLLGAVALGTSGLSTTAFAETSLKPPKIKTLKRKSGKTGLEIFPVVYGGIVSSQDGQKASDNYVAWAIDRGINYFDVAPSYDDAEEKLGISLKSFRKKNYLACKTTKRMRPDAEKEFDR